MSRARAWVAVAVSVAFVLAAAARPPPRTSGSAPAGPGADGARNGTADGAVRGGTLNMLGAGDVDYIDPNVTYYSVGYTVSGSAAASCSPTRPIPRRRRRRCPTWPSSSRPRTTAASARTARRTRHHQAGRAVEHHPPRQVTAADLVIGVKRTCNPAQPFGGLPDFLDLIAGFKEFCDGFADAGQDAPSIKKYIEDDAAPGRRREGRADGRVHPELARHVLRRHARPAVAVAGPGREPQLRAGQHRTRPEPDRERAVQGGQRTSRRSGSRCRATRRGRRRPTRSAARSSTRSSSMRRRARSRCSSSCRPAHPAPT